MIPSRVILLLCGIPAVGKSCYGRALARDHGFVHFDLERYPQGWPAPDLHSPWEASRADFVMQLGQRYQRVVLDWGFPPRCLAWVEELAASGVTVVWLDGDRAAAREAFVQRGGRNAPQFDDQIRNIEAAGLPAALPFRCVGTLNADGTFMELEELITRVFG